MSDLQMAIDFVEELRISYLETSSIKLPNPDWLYSLAKHDDRRNMFDTALAALRDALRRQDGCDVCNHDGFDEMVCYIPTENGDGLMVMSNYCPNCGCEISKQAIKYGAGYVDQDILRSAT